MVRREVERFIELGSDPGLDGYRNSGRDKAEYARLGKKVGRALLKAIGQTSKT